MDYMREINAFYDWAETNQVSPTGILLWHALMYLANRARWPERLAVPISTLEARTGMKRGAIFKARGKLKQCGLIEFESRDGNQSAVYTMLPICVHQIDTTVNTTVNTNVNTNVNTTVDHIGTSYPTDTRTKTKTKTNTERVARARADTQPRFSPPSVDEVTAYCQERNNGIDAQRFVDFYAAKGWRVGNQPMKDWRACVRTWEGRSQDGATGKQNPAMGYAQRKYAADHFDSFFADLDKAGGDAHG